MQQATVERALAQYGLTAQSIAPAQKGYRNESFAVTLPNGEVVNLLFYKADADILPKIKAANFASGLASENSLPARVLHDPRILTLQADNHSSYACLYNYLPGSTILWEAYTMDHIKLVGKTMAKLHTALKDADYATGSVVDNCQKLAEQMRRYFGQTGVQQALRKKLNLEIQNPVLQKLHKLLALDTSSEQLLHMDFVRGNLLFKPATQNSSLTEGKVELSGIIDFEKVARGPVVFDVARTLAFLLVDCKHKTQQQVHKYFLRSGYYKRGGGQAVDPQQLEQLVSFFLFYDLYKFLKHNPYESLVENEHYVRTRDILIERKLLEQV